MKKIRGEISEQEFRAEWYDSPYKERLQDRLRDYSIEHEHKLHHQRGIVLDTTPWEGQEATQKVSTLQNIYGMVFEGEARKKEGAALLIDPAKKKKKAELSDAMLKKHFSTQMDFYGVPMLRRPESEADFEGFSSAFGTKYGGMSNMESTLGFKEKKIGEGSTKPMWNIIDENN